MSATADAPQLPRTSDQILGPFYPLVAPSKGGDLTRKAGHSGRATGQLIHLGGRVLDRSGRPVSGGKLQIWQANNQGRYDHPNDNNPAPLDPCFEGFAVVETDAEGLDRDQFRQRRVDVTTCVDDTHAAAPDLAFHAISLRQRRLKLIE